MADPRVSENHDPKTKYDPKAKLVALRDEYDDGHTEFRMPLRRFRKAVTINLILQNLTNSGGELAVIQSVSGVLNGTEHNTTLEFRENAISATNGWAPMYLKDIHSENQAISILNVDTRTPKHKLNTDKFFYYTGYAGKGIGLPYSLKALYNLCHDEIRHNLYGGDEAKQNRYGSGLPRMKVGDKKFFLHDTTGVSTDKVLALKTRVCYELKLMIKTLAAANTGDHFPRARHRKIMCLFMLSEKITTLQIGNVDKPEIEIRAAIEHFLNEPWQAVKVVCEATIKNSDLLESHRSTLLNAFGLFVGDKADTAARITNILERLGDKPAAEGTYVPHARAHSGENNDELHHEMLNSPQVT